jgi:SMC interacting uncharacterized protein involved in chromosome segregation
LVNNIKTWQITRLKLNVEVDDKPVKSLKAELRETIDQLQRTELGTEAFDKLNQKAS